MALRNSTRQIENGGQKAQIQEQRDTEECFRSHEVSVMQIIPACNSNRELRTARLHGFKSNQTTDNTDRMDQNQGYAPQTTGAVSSLKLLTSQSALNGLSSSIVYPPVPTAITLAWMARAH